MLGLRVIVGVGDGVVADCDRFNIGGDDPDFVGVDEDAVVVEDRLAIQLGFALVAQLGCNLQCDLRAFQLSFHRVLCQFSGEFLLRRLSSRISRSTLRTRYEKHVENQNRDEAACREPEHVFLPRALFQHIGGSTGFKHFRLLLEGS